MWDFICTLALGLSDAGLPLGWVCWLPDSTWKTRGLFVKPSRTREKTYRYGPSSFFPWKGPGGSPSSSACPSTSSLCLRKLLNSVLVSPLKYKQMAKDHQVLESGKGSAMMTRTPGFKNGNKQKLLEMKILRTEIENLMEKLKIIYETPSERITKNHQRRWKRRKKIYEN